MKKKYMQNTKKQYLIKIESNIIKNLRRIIKMRINS